MRRILFSTFLLIVVFDTIYAAGSNANPNFGGGMTISEADDVGDEEDGNNFSKDDGQPPRRVFRLWPNGVVKYKISPSFDSNPDEISRLKASMNDLTRKTCVKFQQAASTDLTGYVSIIPGLKCSSMLGKQEGVSTLMLSIKKCFGNGTLARNLMRVLGFTYENNRADRDNFIQINWENIAESNKKKFTKLSADDYPVTNLPYDFSSVTHYQKNSWAVNKNTWTIRAKKDASLVLGNNRGYSDGDYDKIRKLYKC
jgi:hypothetical protein